MRILLPLLSLCLLASCSYEKRLTRAKKKLGNLVAEFPALVTTDTVFKDTTIYLPAKEINGDIAMDKNYSRIDSIINSYHGKFDSISRLKLTNEIKYYVTNKPILLDTIKSDTMGIGFRIWESHGKLKYAIRVNEGSLKLRYAQQVHSVAPVKEVDIVEWYDWLARAISLLAILFIVFDQLASRNLLKKLKVKGFFS